MKTKTFNIATPEGPKAVRQLATFAYYIQGIQFRFVVTQPPGEQAAVTHRASGKRVCHITHHNALASLGDWVLAGKASLDILIQQHGEARVRSVLASAEV